MSDKHRIIERLMAGIDLIDATEACTLLRIETDETGAVMRRLIREGAVIDIVYNGQVAFPRFQFDHENACIYGVVAAILKVRPAGMRNLRLVH
jgi:hypothetical protein